MHTQPIQPSNKMTAPAFKPFESFTAYVCTIVPVIVCCFIAAYVYTVVELDTCIAYGTDSVTWLWTWTKFLGGYILAMCVFFIIIYYICRYFARLVSLFVTVGKFVYNINAGTVATAAPSAADTASASVAASSSFVSGSVHTGGAPAPAANVVYAAAPVATATPCAPPTCTPVPCVMSTPEVDSHNSDLILQQAALLEEANRQLEQQKRVMAAREREARRTYEHQQQVIAAQARAAQEREAELQREAERVMAARDAEARRAYEHQQQVIAAQARAAQEREAELQREAERTRQIEAFMEYERARAPTVTYASPVHAMPVHVMPVHASPVHASPVHMMPMSPANIVGFKSPSGKCLHRNPVCGRGHLSEDKAIPVTASAAATLPRCSHCNWN